MQAGEPYLAGTARSAVAKISAAKASSLRLKAGDFVRVSASRGSVLLPFEIVEGVEDSVWIPTNSEMSHVRAALGASHGAEVSISHGGAE
jgi:NADH-quinone oxidoreductase subunit G